MSLSRTTRWAIVILVTIVTTIFIFRIPIIKATLPQVKSVNVGAIELDQDSVYISMHLTIQNRDFWSFELKHIELKLYDEQVLVFALIDDTTRVLKRSQAKTEKFRFVIPVSDIVTGILKHQGEDSVSIHIVGKIVYTTIFGQITSDIDRVVTVKVPIPPTLIVRQVDFLGQKEGVFNLLLHTTLVNRNERELEMNDVSYYATGDDILELKGFLPNISIAALDSTRIVIPVSMTLKKKMGLVSRIILDKDIVAYNFVMNGTISSLTGLADEDMKLSVHTTGYIELFDRERVVNTKLAWKKKKN